MQSIVDQKFNEFLESIDQSNVNYDKSKILEAWEFAKGFHAGQKRLSGESFILHPLEVAKITLEWRLDEASIVTALLHDLIEDTHATHDDIERKFGSEIALLVDGLSKVSSIKLREKKVESTIENLRKFILVMAKDLRVVLVKLADRLHNMRTIKFLPPEKGRRIAMETLEIYAPLAERLGIGAVKGELEDLAFEVLYPNEYIKVLETSKDEFKDASEIIKKMHHALFKDFAKHKINVQFNARKKRLYSLWKKLQREGVDWDYSGIYDIVALRIIVATKSDCYAALGIVHENYKPVPTIPISDFIAQPKPNGYQSIHTKVFGPKGRIVEVQIRTKEMHEIAEKGIASHWIYSETKSVEKVNIATIKRGVAVDETKHYWVRELVRWQEEVVDSKEYLDALKFDVLNHRNYIFSPKGDVFDLPAGATPIDFACLVHSNLIDFVKGVLVNGKYVRLDHELKSGDVVEIIKSKNPKKPSKDWLDFVKTVYAKRQIEKRLAD